jgi:hypothetical protein
VIEIEGHIKRKFEVDRNKDNDRQNRQKRQKKTEKAEKDEIKEKGRNIKTEREEGREKERV